MKNVVKRSFLTIPLVSLLLTSCGTAKYGASFYDDVEEQLTAVFIDFHTDPSGEKNLPTTQVYVVDSDRLYDEVFKPDYKKDIDFEKQFIVLFSFRSIYKNEHYLSSIDLSDGVLKIECDYKKGSPGTGYACAPYDRWCYIQMDIVEYNTISFVGEGR